MKKSVFAIFTDSINQYLENGEEVLYKALYSNHWDIKDKSWKYLEQQFRNFYK